MGTNRERRRVTVIRERVRLMIVTCESVKGGGHAFYRIIFSSLILFREVCGDIFGGFSNKRFSLCNQCTKSTSSLEHPECCIRCTSACGRFRVWLHFTSRDDCLQTIRYGETVALGSYLRRLES